MSGAAATQTELQAALKARLVETGEYDKMLDLLKAKLAGSQWEEQLRAKAKDQAAAQPAPTLQGVVNTVEPEALKSVPTDVRKEIEGMLQSFVEKNVE